MQAFAQLSVQLFLPCKKVKIFHCISKVFTILAQLYPVRAACRTVLAIPFGKKKKRKCVLHFRSLANPCSALPYLTPFECHYPQRLSVCPVNDLVCCQPLYPYGQPLTEFLPIVADCVIPNLNGIAARAILYIKAVENALPHLLNPRTHNGTTNAEPLGILADDITVGVGVGYFLFLELHR